MSQRTTRKYAVPMIAAITLIAGAAMISSHLPAQAQISLPGQVEGNQGESNNGAEPKPSFQIGTYDPQAVFQQHPAKEDMAKAAAQIREKMAKVREEGSQKKMQQLYQEYEQQRQEIIAGFESDVDEKIPAVAKDAGVKAVAMDIAYTAQDTGTKDITSDLVKAFQDQEESKKQETPEERPAGLQLPAERE